MSRLRNAPLAVLALLATTSVAGAASLPDAATKGLTIAAEHSGHVVPVRPASHDNAGAPAAAVSHESTTDVTLPDAVGHGVAVSTVAKAPDATPDTNHGADVSAVARDNHGQATAAQHRPAEAGKPADAGKPDSVGKTDDVPGQSTDPGKPADPGRP
jgi:hypothetical protein